MLMKISLIYFCEPYFKLAKKILVVCAEMGGPITKVLAC